MSQNRTATIPVSEIMSSAESQATKQLLMIARFKSFLQAYETNTELADYIIAHIADIDENIFSYYPLLLEAKATNLLNFSEDIKRILKHIQAYHEKIITYALSVNVHITLRICIEELKYNRFILNAFIQSPISRERHLQAAILYCIDLNNAVMLSEFNTYFQAECADIFDKMDDENRVKAEKLLALPENKRVEVTHYLKNFTSQFSRLSVDDGLLVCARIAAKPRDYDFNPTLITRQQQQTYFDILKAATYPVRERFIETGVHWISADIQIANDGKASIYIIDPLSITNTLAAQYNWLDSSGAFMLARTFLRYFPNGEIFISDIKRQYSSMSCCMFALDDIRHLFTIEKYLSRNGYDDLFDYLKKASPPIPQEYNFASFPNILKVNYCRMPLSLLRTTQSRSIYNELSKSPADELTTPINKKNELAKQSIDSGFQSGSQNNRLLHKFRLMGIKNLHFILETSAEEREAAKRAFTLEGLRERLAGKPDPDPKIPLAFVKK